LLDIYIRTEIIWRVVKFQQVQMKISKSNDNVFRVIGFPEGEAQNLLLRTDLMLKIERIVKKNGGTQSEAAQMLGITQPRLNDLLKGRVEKFSLDALVNMVARAGMEVRMTIRKVSKNSNA
jgi:predicted XRE-type DNA-binding protein